MYILEFTKTISNISKLDADIRANCTKYQSCSIKGDQLQVMFSTSLTQAEVNNVSALITTFVEVDVTEELKEHVSKTISPFIEDFMYQILAENIEMGITQAGKTAEVLGFFCHPFVLPGKTRGVSIKDSLDTCSLTVTVEVLNYLIANPDLYSDLSPYVTSARLTAWRDSTIAVIS